MNRSSILASVALGVAVAVVSAAPASAAAFASGSVVQSGTEWFAYSFEVGESPYIDLGDNADWAGEDYTYDTGLQPIFAPTGASDDEWGTLSCAAEGDRQNATDGTGDIIISCPLQEFDSGDGTLAGTFEYRFFADGSTVRSRIIVSNETDAVVSGAAVGIYENYYQDSDTLVGASTTAGEPAPEGTIVADGDRAWAVYSDAVNDGYESPVVLTAAGSANAPVGPSFPDTVAGAGEDYQVTMYTLPDIAPASSVEVVQFTVWTFFSFDEAGPVSAPTETETTEPAPTEPAPTDTEPTDTAPAETEPTDPASTETASTETAAADETTVATTEAPALEPAALFVPSALDAVMESWAAVGRFTALSARDAAGIADPAAVVNWNPAAEDTLANTGAADEALLIGGLAMLLVVAGSVTVALRRRSA